MARTFKFSFPLPSRRPSAERQPTLIYDECDAPLYNPGAKAEMILGTSERSVVEVKKQPPKKEKKIRRYPSFMSVIIAETDSSLHKNKDIGSEPQLHSQPSSPLLGQQHANESPDRDSATGFFGLQHRSQSSSSLRSYYDPSKSPLNVSQQTSASSARDMALRKGHFTIASPQDQNVSGIGNTPRKKDRKYTKGSPRASTKRHPASDLHLNVSSISQQPHASDSLILSPDRAARSPSQVSLGSNFYQPAQSGRAKWFTWERKKSKDSIPNFTSNFQEVSIVRESTQTPVKSATKKPSKIYKNWFNDISEEENSPADRSQDLASKTNGTPIALKRNENAENHRIRRSKSNIGGASHDSILSHATPKSLPNIAPAQPVIGPKRQRTYSNGTQRTSSNDSRRSEPSRKPSLTVVLSETDLHTQSFLALTSSEDESEDQPSNEAMSRRHRIRASIEKADTGDEVLVCSAERVKPIKPRPVVNRPRRRGGSPKKSDVIPPVPSIPTRPQLNPRVSSMKWQDETKIPPTGSEKRDTSDHSRESSSASRSASQLSQSGSQRMAPSRGSKMMAVTAEEEKLLEAMRRKRASIRQEALNEQTDDTKQMHSNSNSISRPRTAGAGDRPGPSSYFDIDRSASSPTPSHGYAKYMNTPSYAASVGNLSGEDSSAPPSPSSFPQTPAAFTFPPPLSKETSVQYFPKKTAPSLSFSPSDILPSTPAMSDATGEEIYGTLQHGSRTSPVTPPPGHVLDMYESELAITVSHPHDSALYLNKKSPNRKRAIDSSVMVLNGVERETPELGEENDMTRWTMDKW